ncbi:hypothetical protein ACFQQB_59085 [Nonomuraea rubra]|uniref:hypothetical protein n=1 Tax=Nonomuraea rubra TaxID=46180 RepID=UPI00360FC39A
MAGREVVQHGRPNKRVFKVTQAGLDELAAFAATPAKPCSCATTWPSRCTPRTCWTRPR